MEEPRRRENWQDLVTAEQIEKYNAIQLKTMETKKLSRTDGAFLKKLDRKTRVCNSCGRTVEEAKGWGVFDFVNPDGTRIPCGYDLMCFECTMKEIMFKGILGQLQNVTYMNTLLDIVIRITDKSMGDATDMLTFIFSFALVVGLVLAIWFNTKSGQRWIDRL